MVLSKEIVINPYFRSISVQQLQYQHVLQRYTPTERTKQPEAAFVYGLGGYVSADTFERVGDVPVLRKPRRHHVLTFAKLSWRYRPLDQLFGATCSTSDNHCAGLHHRYKTRKAAPIFDSLHENDKGTPFRYLLVGNASIDDQFGQRGFSNPTTLVSLQAAMPMMLRTGERYEWEVLSSSHVRQSSLKPSTASECTREIDEYVAHIRENRYHLEDPLLPMFASSIFHLFERAGVADAQELHVKALKSSTRQGSEQVAIDLNGNERERKVIRFKVPGFSVYVTCIGIGVMWLAAIAVAVLPKKPHKFEADDPLAQQFMDVIDREEYPPTVHKRYLLVKDDVASTDDPFFGSRASLTRSGTQLKKSGKSVAALAANAEQSLAGEEVDLNDCEVDRVLLQHREYPVERICFTSEPNHDRLNELANYRPACAIQ